MKRSGYCIFIDALCEGAVPCVREARGGDLEAVCVFPTEREAQLEIVDAMMIRLQQFVDGERDFDDAMTVEEYIVAVDVFPNGAFVDADGNRYGADGQRWGA